jgi:hypothetical protein
MQFFKNLNLSAFTPGAVLLAGVLALFVQQYAQAKPGKSPSTS